MEKVLCSERVCRLMVLSMRQVKPFHKNENGLTLSDVGISFKSNDILQNCGSFFLSLNLLS